MSSAPEVNCEKTQLFPEESSVKEIPSSLIGLGYEWEHNQVLNLITFSNSRQNLLPINYTHRSSGLIFKLCMQISHGAGLKLCVLCTVRMSILNIAGMVRIMKLCVACCLDKYVGLGRTACKFGATYTAKLTSTPRPRIYYLHPNLIYNVCPRCMNRKACCW